MHTVAPTPLPLPDGGADQSWPGGLDRRASSTFAKTAQPPPDGDRVEGLDGPGSRERSTASRSTERGGTTGYRPLVDLCGPVLIELGGVEAGDEDLVAALRQLTPGPFAQELWAAYLAHHRYSDAANKTTIWLHRLTENGRRIEQRDVAELARVGLGTVSAVVDRYRHLGVLETTGGEFDPATGQNRPLTYCWHFAAAIPLSSERRLQARLWLWARAAGVEEQLARDCILGKRIARLRLEVQSSRLRARRAADPPASEEPVRSQQGRDEPLETAPPAEPPTGARPIQAGVAAIVARARPRSNPINEAGDEYGSGLGERLAPPKSNKGIAKPSSNEDDFARIEPGRSSSTGRRRGAGWSRSQRAELSFLIDSYGDALADNSPPATRSMVLAATGRCGLAAEAVLGAFERAAGRTKEDLDRRAQVRGRPIEKAGALLCWRFLNELERLVVEVA